MHHDLIDPTRPCPVRKSVSPRYWIQNGRMGRGQRQRVTMCCKIWNACSQQAGRLAIFFCKRGLPSRDISANHMARISSTSYMYMCTYMYVNVCAILMIPYVILKYAPYDWLKCNPRLQNKKSRPVNVIIQITSAYVGNQTSLFIIRSCTL